MNTDRPINITVNVENKPYWEAAGQGKLVLRKCNSCGKMHHYPRTI
ncbi:MAG TPA: nucleic acid-binding protein, partial [Rhodobiaceae bacterium]|nr:nucleic acid-binding protein [Rhodobiaceae bacterium]